MASAQEKAHGLLDRLEQEHPDATIALEFKTPLELLVATILAAQCRDERVNQVTRGLFEKYRTAADWASSPPGVLELEVKSLGFFNQKARAVREACRQLVEVAGGEVPEDLELLTKLRGVGRKTANVVLGNAFGHRDRVAVDTHVLRLSQRFGWTESRDPEQVERDVEEVVPAERRTRACHLLQFHGRRICHARKPDCGACPLSELCPSAFAEVETKAKKPAARAKATRSPRRAAPAAQKATRGRSRSSRSRGS